jgi:hypothetical protein
VILATSEHKQDDLYSPLTNCLLFIELLLPYLVVLFFAYFYMFPFCTTVVSYFTHVTE